jgi:hypothetical protein
MTVATQVLTKLAALSEEQQRQVLAYVEQLETARKTPAGDPYGSCADLRTDLPYEEFQRNRGEMWGDASDKEL